MASFLLMKSINKLLRNKQIYQKSKQSISYLLTKLVDKKLIRINGKDSYDYIQGLVTNDIRHLEPNNETSVELSSIHSFMLNLLGRVITDLFIYKSIYSQDKELLLEIDGHLLQPITKFLNSYRVRRKVKIDIENSRQVWVLFPSKLQKFEELVEEKENVIKTLETLKNEEIFVVKDPRLKEIGFRLLFKPLDNNNDKEISDRIKSILNSKHIELSETEVNDYHKYRYNLGVGEGLKDFPVESCFPLECNADYLHGVSFHKGCYVGQELTARIYHTGVIRKRLMPIQIINDREDPQVYDSIPLQNIVTNEGKNVGKFRSNSGEYGLALLKFEDAIKANKLILNQTNLQIKTWIPFWWPKEVNRDSMPCGRAIH